MFFCTLCVIEHVKRTDKIAGDAADTLKADRTVFFSASALGAGIADNAVITALGVTVYRMIDGTVADAAFLHSTDNAFECFQIVGGIAIQLNISDVTCVGQCMIRSLDLDLLICTERVVYRYMEGVGILFTIGNTGDYAKLLLVDTDKTSGQALCRSSKKREV